MAEPPGILCQGRNPVNTKDGTMCAAQTPMPGITGNRSLMDMAGDSLSWAGNEVWAGTQWVGGELLAGAQWTGGELWAGTKWAGGEIWSGAEWAGVEIAAGAKWSWGEIRGGAVWLGNKAYDAYKYLLALMDKVKKAANWDVLKAIAEPILGPYFEQAGILWGIVESLGKDVLSLLQLGKMVLLASCYELMAHPEVATALALNPTTMPMVLTALALKAAGSQIPGLAAELKKADDQLKKMLTDLWSIVSSWDGFVKFVKAAGHQIKQETVDEFNKLKSYAQNRTLGNDFQAGRILGRALYQVLMIILIVVGLIGAVRAAAGFLARVPALLRVARVIKASGEVEDLIETEKVIQGTKDAEELAEAENATKKPDLSTNAKKGVFGEANADAYMKNQGYEKMNGPEVQVGDSPKGNGIDGIYKNTNPPPEYVIGEAKFGSSRLGTLKDGTKQMSDKWIDERLNSELGRADADAVRDAQARGQVENWLLQVDDQGNVTKTVLK